jgi:hypothetical protein
MTDRQATEETRASINEMASSLPMQDRQDFDDATRGFVGRSEQRRITTDNGQTQPGPTRHDRTPLKSEEPVQLAGGRVFAERQRNIPGGPVAVILRFVV